MRHVELAERQKQIPFGNDRQEGQRQGQRKILFGNDRQKSNTELLIVTDGDAAVGGFYLNGWATLADLRVDVIADGALGCYGEGNGDATVDGGCDEVSGIVVRSIDGDAAVGGFGEKSFSMPLRAFEDDFETAVDGRGVNFAAEIA